MKNLDFFIILSAQMQVNTKNFHESYPFVRFLHEEKHSWSSNIAKMNVFQEYSIST